MKRILFAVFLLLGCLSIHAESVHYGFKELSPINDDNENTQDKKLIFEKDWEGVEYTEWGYLEDPPIWTYYEATDEGLAITNSTVNDHIFDVRVQNGFFSLEEGHDYLVRLIVKVPSDGDIFMLLGSWSSSWYDHVSVTASDDWQVIDIDSPNYYCDISGNAYVLLGLGEMVGTTILKKVQVYEKLKGGETYIKTTKPDKAVDAIYNLSGQRVSPSYKGIVIQNGKKRIAR